MGISKKIVVRNVPVERGRNPEKIIDDTGFNQRDIDYEVLHTMPDSEHNEVHVHFFKVGRRLTFDDLKKEYELRGLVPNPRAQAAVNERDPSFVDEHPNGSQWGDKCFLTFYRWIDDELNVRCDRDNGGGWHEDWWFAGVRK